MPQNEESNNLEKLRLEILRAVIIRVLWFADRNPESIVLPQEVVALGGMEALGPLPVTPVVIAGASAVEMRFRGLPVPMVIPIRMPLPAFVEMAEMIQDDPVGCWRRYVSQNQLVSGRN